MASNANAVKLYALFLVKMGTKEIFSSNYDLSHFWMFRRSKSKTELTSICVDLLSKIEIQPNTTTSTQTTNDYIGLHKIHYFFNSNAGIGFVVITDHNYPTRISCALGRKCIQHISANHLENVEKTFEDYKRPSIDVTAMIQTEVEQTNQIMKQVVDKLLDRGEKLEGLENSCDVLRNASSTFLVQSKTLNGCCILI
jgi:hypothetical protein